MTTREIHPQAILGAGARLGEGVKIGAYAIVGKAVELGDFLCRSCECPEMARPD